MQHWSPLSVHAEWIVRLREYVYGVGEMDSETTARDDRCELGRWIYGEGARYAHLDEYRRAREMHAEFHRQAAWVVRLVESGRRLEAAAEIGAGGRLRKKSVALVQAFSQLNQQIIAGAEGDQPVA